MSKTIKNKNNRGFYLVEAIMAIFLLTAGLLVTVDLLSKTVSNGMADRDNITAVLLAQEGIEVVRNLRDTNFAQAKDAFDPSIFPANSDNNCWEGIYGSNFPCFTTPDYKLYLDSNKFYVYPGSSTTLTKFQRRMTIAYSGSSSDPSTSATITCLVTWNGNTPPSSIAGCTASAKCAYAQTVLTKWE